MFRESWPHSQRRPLRAVTMELVTALPDAVVTSPWVSVWAREHEARETKSKRVSECVWGWCGVLIRGPCAWSWKVTLCSPHSALTAGWHTATRCQSAGGFWPRGAVQRPVRYWAHAVQWLRGRVAHHCLVIPTCQGIFLIAYTYVLYSSLGKAFSTKYLSIQLFDSWSRYGYVSLFFLGLNFDLMHIYKWFISCVKLVWFWTVIVLS